DYLYADVLQAPEPWPAAVMRLFPVDVRDAQGQLTRVSGVPLATHLERLDVVRVQLLATLQAMALEEFRRPRALPTYQVTPEWVGHPPGRTGGDARGHLALGRGGGGGAAPPQ